MYKFEGNLDIESYFKLAQSLNLSVVLRPGPFIDAERDMVLLVDIFFVAFSFMLICYFLFFQGGLPYWLMTVNPLMKLRTSDASMNHEKIKISFYQIFNLFCVLSRLCALCGTMVYYSTCQN